MRRIVLSQRNAVLVFLLVFELYEGQVLAQAVTESYTTTADVALRSGPGMKYSVVTTLPKGININVVGREGYWPKLNRSMGVSPAGLCRRTIRSTFRDHTSRGFKGYNNAGHRRL